MQLLAQHIHTKGHLSWKLWDGTAGKRFHSFPRDFGLHSLRRSSYIFIKNTPHHRKTYLYKSYRIEPIIFCEDVKKFLHGTGLKNSNHYHKLRSHTQTINEIGTISKTIVYHKCLLSSKNLNDEIMCLLKFGMSSDERNISTFQFVQRVFEPHSIYVMCVCEAIWQWLAA